MLPGPTHGRAGAGSEAAILVMELEQAAMELGTRERAEITGAGQLTKPATQRRGNTNSIAAHKLSLFSLRKCSPQLARPHYMQPKEIHGGDRFPSGFVCLVRKSSELS